MRSLTYDRRTEKRQARRHRDFAPGRTSRNRRNAAAAGHLAGRGGTTLISRAQILVRRISRQAAFSEMPRTWPRHLPNTAAGRYRPGNATAVLTVSLPLWLRTREVGWPGPPQKHNRYAPFGSLAFDGSSMSHRGSNGSIRHALIAASCRGNMVGLHYVVATRPSQAVARKH